MTESERDQIESGFTPLLRWLLVGHPQVEAVSFADAEGECVDYCSRVPPFDAKVAVAQLVVTMRQVREAMSRLASGELINMVISGEGRDIAVRRLDDHYCLAVLAAAGSVDLELLGAIDRLAHVLRNEAGLSPPPWDPQAGALEVETRPAIGWAFAPTAYRQGTQSVRIAAVLGRWTEDSAVVGGDLMCFRVRTAEGAELTLAFDRLRSCWMRW